jgi:hypothetical protein
VRTPPQPSTGPSWAERARTALAGASVATLVTSGRASRRVLATVAVADRPDGRPTVWLETSSPVVRRLSRRPVATLMLAGSSPVWSVRLAGALTPCYSDRPGQSAYRMALFAVMLVGSTRVPVPVAEFTAATPDPIRARAGELLDHLEQAHADELLACAWAHGYDAESVLPRGLDRYGLELVALGKGGVSRFRLPFPDGPVADVADIGPGLDLPLGCRCLRTSS